MGDPADSSAEEQREQGIDGWIIASRGRVVAVVGPSFAKDLQFLNYTHFIEIAGNAEKTKDAVGVVTEQVKAVSARSCAPLALFEKP